MTRGPQPADLLAPVVRQALGEATDADLLAAFCEQLVSAGVPLRRSYVILRTLHPVIGGYLLEWQRDTATVERSHWERAEEEEGDAEGADNEWTRSPLYRLVTTGAPSLRQRLSADAGPFEFLLFDELAAAGATDYYAALTRFDENAGAWPFAGMLSSWTSDHPDGFSDGHVALIDGALPFFAVAMKAVSTQHVARTLLETYLGREVGGRVLNGEIDRGSADSIRAVVWYADLRDFTRIADTSPREQLIPLLNAYFEAMIGPLHAHGGEVLKFLGDGLLAIFRLDDGRDACAAAIAAAEQVLTDVAALNETRSSAGQPTSQFHLGFHLGEVLYGNIGAPDRLDFTVVGPTVNEASRIVAMCRAIDRDVVISAAFAAAAAEARATGADRLISLGRFALRGVRQPQELFTLFPPEA